MPTDQDTEITLGTAKMLGLFFGLVILCAVFFGMGFSVGRNSVKVSPVDTEVSVVKNSATPAAAAKPNAPATNPDLTFYKAVEQKDPNAQLSAPQPVNSPKEVNPSPPTDNPPEAENKLAVGNPAPVPDAAAAPPTNAYYVQVAAITNKDDAEALVEALKKKQYAAFSATATTDKFFHVQIGPFSDIKVAEATKAKLVGDGYNPILKR
jgi:DedD protein